MNIQSIEKTNDTWSAIDRNKQNRNHALQMSNVITNVKNVINQKKALEQKVGNQVLYD